MGNEGFEEMILDHYRNPRNYGRIEHPTSAITEYNPVCGDALHFTVNIRNSRIEDIKFIGRGCSVSMAAASILTERVKGMEIHEVEQIREEVFLKSLGIYLGPVREKCALLSLNALKKIAGGKRDES